MALPLPPNSMTMLVMGVRVVRVPVLQPRVAMHM